MIAVFDTPAPSPSSIVSLSIRFVLSTSTDFVVSRKFKRARTGDDCGRGNRALVDFGMLGAIIAGVMTVGSNGQMPVFRNPALTFSSVNALRNGCSISPRYISFVGLPSPARPRSKRSCAQKRLNCENPTRSSAKIGQ